jgi:S1-C subfamily serine protease
MSTPGQPDEQHGTTRPKPASPEPGAGVAAGPGFSSGDAYGQANTRSEYGPRGAVYRLPDNADIQPGGYQQPEGYGRQAGYRQAGYVQPGGQQEFGEPRYGQPVPPGVGGQRPRKSRKMMAGIAAVVVALLGGAVVAWVVGRPANKPLSTTSIVQMTDPAVVDVASPLGGQNAEAFGTGIVLSSDGVILTNNHVVDGATSVTVTDIGNGRSYTATVVGYNPTHDIAVLKLQNASGLRTATIGSSGSVRVGQKVVAVGNAGGRGGLPSVASGHVTGLNAAITAADEGSGSSEHLTGMIRTNAGIKPGDSGGPLLNTSGQVIGINTAASTAMMGAPASSEHAFSIPISRAIAIAKKIEAGQGSGTVHIGPTAFLGVEVSSQQSGSLPGSGATVEGVVQDGPAAAAGIQAGDAIVEIGGKAVTSPTTLRNDLVTFHPGNPVTVIWRTQDGQNESANLTPGIGPTA